MTQIIMWIFTIISTTGFFVLLFYTIISNNRKEAKSDAKENRDKLSKIDNKINILETKITYIEKQLSEIQNELKLTSKDITKIKANTREKQPYRVQESVRSTEISRDVTHMPKNTEI